MPFIGSGDIGELRREPLGIRGTSKEGRRYDNVRMVDVPIAAKRSRMVLPLEAATDTEHGHNVIVIARPQAGVFYPERLVIPQDMASDWLIDDIMVGRNSQIMQGIGGQGGIPGDVFSSSAGVLGMPMHMDVAATGIDIAIAATRVGPGSGRFRAALFGSSEQRKPGHIEILEAIIRCQEKIAARRPMPKAAAQAIVGAAGAALGQVMQQQPPIVPGIPNDLATGLLGGIVGALTGNKAASTAGAGALAGFMARLGAQIGKPNA